MTPYILQPVVVRDKKPSIVLVADTRKTCPSWEFILHTEIEPLCARYGLVIEYGDDEQAESCAIFYGASGGADDMRGTR